MILNLAIHFHCIRCGRRTKTIDQRKIDAIWFDPHMSTRLDFLCPKCYEDLTGPNVMSPEMKLLQDRNNGVLINATKFVKQRNLRIG